MRHELKIWPQFFCRLKDGSKTFEVRDCSSGFQRGDTVLFKEFDPTPINASDKTSVKGYTQEEIEFEIGYVQILDKDQVVFSLLPLKKTKGK